MSDQKLKLRIMRRVYVIYWWRRLNASPLAKLALVVGGASGVAIFVSIIDVFHNTWGLGEKGEMFPYLWRAFVPTEWVVQTLAVGTALLAALAGRDILANLIFKNFRKSGRLTISRARLS